MKLIYFDGRAKAELARILLSYGGVEYEDVRVKAEDWPEVKQKTPFGVLPVLDVDGEVMSEHSTIVRFVARKVGLLDTGPDTLVEQAQTEMVLDNTEELWIALLSVTYPPNDEALESNIKTVNEEKIPKFVANAEKLLVSRGGKYFVGNKLSLADVAMFHYLTMLTNPTEPFLIKYKGDRLGKARLSCLENAPALRDLVKMVGAVPNIKKWMESRPSDDVEFI